MGKIEGQTLLSANGWEEVKGRGEAAIKKWIADEMSGKSCVVVLIGSDTASRKWVKYEIKKGWDDGKGVVGVYIHKLKNLMASKRQKVPIHSTSSKSAIRTWRQSSRLITRLEPRAKRHTRR